MLKTRISRCINVSRVVDLFEVESGEFSNGLRYCVNVEMVYYIAEGFVRVLGDIVFPYIRFGKCVIKLRLHFIQCQIRFWECVRHGEPNIQEQISLIWVGWRNLTCF